MQEAPSKQEAPANKQYGCLQLAVRAVVVIAVVVGVDYLSAMIFADRHPHNEVTARLVPFQNHYLAATDAFITSEGIVTEFSIDPCVTTRFLSMFMLPCIAFFVLAVILWFIPFTRRLLDYFWYGIGVILVLVLVHAQYFPPVKTVFDGERKVMEVHRSKWWFIDDTTEIPYAAITGFSYELGNANSNYPHDDVEYANIFATTTSGKILIGENQLAQHSESESYVPPAATVREIQSAIDALYQLTGIAPL